MRIATNQGVEADFVCNYFTKAAIIIRGVHVRNLTELDFADYPSIETMQVAHQGRSFRLPTNMHQGSRKRT